MGDLTRTKGIQVCVLKINVVSTSDAHIRDLNYNTFYGIVFKYRHLNTVFCFCFGSRFKCSCLNVLYIILDFSDLTISEIEVEGGTR